MIEKQQTKIIRAPRGTSISCKSWQTEAPMRMLMNNLDPEVAKDPANLIVYGGRGKAARNWECFYKIVETLKELEMDETLLIQSGKPVAVFRTHEWAPRVLIANSLLVPKWADWEYFRELEERGLIMYGQMTAGSWIYIGTQGILQGTYETFYAVAKKYFDGTLKGKFVLTAGLGEMGGAQPLAATMNGAVILAVEVDKRAIDRRLKTGYLDTWTDSLDEALRIVEEAKKEGKALSVGLLANAAEVLPELVKRGVIPDVVTDHGANDAFEIPGYVPEYIRPLFCEGSGPFRWAALSGDPNDIYKTDEKVLELFPEDDHLRTWIEMAQRKVKWQGLPARICWLRYGEREKLGLAINEMVKRGELKAPIVIGRDHHDTGSVASPYRETEAMKDGSDAIADWPILNALLNTASGATWVSVHHGGGVGIGYSIHAGMVAVADGTRMAQQKLSRVLNNDPGLGVVRHADAGYEIAISTAKKRGIKVPMID